MEAMKTALRVLTAIVERREPASHDVEDLVRYRGTGSGLPPDELACEVIQRATKVRVRVFEALS